MCGGELQRVDHAKHLVEVATRRHRAGRRDEALELLGELEAQSAREYVSSFDLALLHLAVGHRDRALERLSKAHEEHASYMPFINVDPRLDDLRTDPRVQAIVQHLRFPA